MSTAFDLSQALQACVDGRTLTRAQTRDVFGQVLAGRADSTQLGGLLAALATRGETVDEVAGAVDALRDAMVVFEHDHPGAIDTCGTGGDGLGLVNLSTAAAIVAAAAGAKVVKHGNRAVSSRCGSADLLEAAGIRVERSPRSARTVLDEVGITFLFAPQYHPALRNAAPIRRALGVRTIFNWIGPLANPGRVRRQLLGVGRAERIESTLAVLRELGHARALVVHGAGGADELTLAGANSVRALGFSSAPSFDASSVGLKSAPTTALSGGDAAINLRAIERAFDGEASPIADAIALNAGAALTVAEIETDALRAVERAVEALRSGRARATFARWIELAQRTETLP